MLPALDGSDPEPTRPTRVLLVDSGNAAPALETALWGDGRLIGRATPGALVATLRERLPDVAVLVAGAPWSEQALHRLAEYAPDVPVVEHGDDVQRTVDQLRTRFPLLPRLALSGAIADLQACVVHRDGKRLRLTPLEIKLLRYFAANPGRAIADAELLTRVWGYDKGVRSRTATSTLHRLRKKVEADPSTPTSFRSVYGHGCRYVPLVAPPTDPPAPSEASSAPGVELGVPAPEGVPVDPPAARDTFVGRESELVVLSGLWSHTRLVTLTGTGGVGKTRLATECVRRSAGDYPGGAWLADLSLATTPDGVAYAVALALGVQLGPQDPKTLVGNVLVGRGSMLLVLDCCERAVVAVAELASAWLDRAPALRLLVTCREPLRIRGEQLFDVDPLPLPASDSPEAVGRSQAVQLLCARSQAADIGFRLTDANAADIAAVVRLLDGLPLAIELAACHARELTPGNMRVALQHRFELLQSDERDRIGRHRTLWAAIDWSWASLSDDHKRALAILSTFEGGATVDAVAAVLQVDEAAAGRRLAALVRKNLVQVRGPQGDEARRYGLLDSIRDFAANRLVDPGAFPGAGPAAAQAAEGRHGEHYSQQGCQASDLLQTPEGLALRRALTPDLDNLATACRRAVARGDVAVAVGSCKGVWKVAAAVGPLSVAMALMDAVGPLADQNSDDALFIKLMSGVADHLAGRHARAATTLEEVIGLAQRIGNVAREVAASGELGSVYRALGRGPDGRQHLRRAVELAHEIGDRSLEASWLRKFGAFCSLQGQPDEARDHLQAALQINQQHGTPTQIAMTRSYLGSLCMEYGDPAECKDHYMAALAFYRRSGNRRLAQNVLCNLGALHLDLDEPALAEEVLSDPLVVHRDTGERSGECHALATLSRLAERQGDLEVARAQALGALAVARELGDRLREGQLLCRIAQFDAHSGQFEGALASLDAAAPLVGGQRRAMASLLADRAEVLSLAGDAAGARAALDEAGTMCDELPQDNGVLARRIDALRTRFSATGGTAPTPDAPTP